MKSRIVKLMMTCMLMVCLAGCTKSDQPDIAYMDMEDMGAFDFNVQPITTEDAEEVPSYAIESLEASGQENLQESVTPGRLVVYNEPDDTSAQIGRLESGVTVSIIEHVDDSWDKIVYKGRVAYIEVVNEQDEDVQPNAVAVEQPVVADPNAAAVEQPVVAEPNAVAAEQPVVADPNAAAVEQPVVAEPNVAAAEQPVVADPNAAAPIQ